MQNLEWSGPCLQYLPLLNSKDFIHGILAATVLANAPKVLKPRYILILKWDARLHCGTSPESGFVRLTLSHQGSLKPTKENWHFEWKGWLECWDFHRSHYEGDELGASRATRPRTTPALSPLTGYEGVTRKG